jgi:two-component system, chemotaxis family, chemotaxis protein CheY
MEAVKAAARLRVLSVGQCGYDDAQIGALLREFGAFLDRAGEGDEARRKLAATAYALVLVNRILDATGDSGVALIGVLKKAGTAVPLMLVSDHADAQAAAVAEGAAPGFGKSALSSAATRQRLQAVLASGQ